MHVGPFCVINMLDKSRQKAPAIFSFQKPFYNLFIRVVEPNIWIAAKAAFYYLFCAHAPLFYEVFVRLVCCHKTIVFPEKKAPVICSHLDRCNARQNYSSRVLLLNIPYKDKSILCKYDKSPRKWLVNIGKPRRYYNQREPLYLMSVPGGFHMLPFPDTSLIASYALMDFPKADKIATFRNRPDVRLSYNRIWLPSLGTRGQGV